MSQNLLLKDYSLKDLLDLVKKDIFLTLNCCHLGTIKKFDPENQTCDVTIDYKKTFYKLDKKGNYYQQPLEYPLLVKCPVIIMGGSGGSLRFPIKEGDKTLVVFNDRDIDKWFDGNSGAIPNTLRLHSLSDGFALIGIRPKGMFIPDYDPDEGGIFVGETKVALKEKIKIENAAQNLSEVLGELIDAIKNISVAGVTPGSGNSTGLNPTSTAALDQVAIKLEALLE